jgi:hypothetical protein
MPPGRFPRLPSAQGSLGRPRPAGPPDQAAAAALLPRRGERRRAPLPAADPGGGTPGAQPFPGFLRSAPNMMSLGVERESKPMR